jgi:hypothetical protein
LCLFCGQDGIDKFFVNCSDRKGSLIGNKKCDLSISFMPSKYKNPSSTKYKNPSFTKYKNPITKYKNPSFTKNIKIFYMD